MAGSRNAVICGRCVLAAPLCDRCRASLHFYACSVGFASCETLGKRHRASLRDPQIAGSLARRTKNNNPTRCGSGKVAGVELCLLCWFRIVRNLGQALSRILALPARCVLATHTKKQDYDRWVIVLLFGADGGGRTRTVLLPTDFESVTSANSITSADIVFVKAHCVTIITISQFDYYIIAVKCCQ